MTFYRLHDKFFQELERKILCNNSTFRLQPYAAWNKISVIYFSHSDGGVCKLLPFSEKAAPLKAKGAFICQLGLKQFQKYMLHRPIILDQSQTTWRRKVRIKTLRRDRGQGLSVAREQHPKRKRSGAPTVWMNLSTWWLTSEERQRICFFKIYTAFWNLMIVTISSPEREFCMSGHNQARALECSPWQNCKYAFQTELFCFPQGISNIYR